LRTTDESPDPLRAALAEKERTGAPGELRPRVLGSGEGWRAVDLLCTLGPPDAAREERHRLASVSVVRAGVFGYRGEHGRALLSPGALLLGNAGQAFTCGHEHGAGDRCLSFQLEPELLARVALEAGAARSRFATPSLPPSRAMASVVAQAVAAGGPRLEEAALELVGAALLAAGGAVPRAAAPGDERRVARLLRTMEAQVAEPHPLSELAREAGLGRFQLLRAFKRVTGLTPHQWLLRARLREAARILTETAAPVTEVALEVGFADLSHFIRAFQLEFGATPGRYGGRRRPGRAAHP
jgi:AraC family transcriptional regulator